MKQNSKEKIIVDLRFLIELVEEQLTDQEILAGFMQYYFAQSRTLSDLRRDFIFRIDKMTFGRYESNQYKVAIENVRRVLKEYLKLEFNVVESMIKLD